VGSGEAATREPDYIHITSTKKRRRRGINEIFSKSDEVRHQSKAAPRGLEEKDKTENLSVRLFEGVIPRAKRLAQRKGEGR